MRSHLLILLSVFISSCSKDTYIDITDQCVFPQLFTNQCFWGNPGGEYDEIVFISNDEFESFTDSIRIFPININCDTATVPYIDFDAYTLLGKYTKGGGCNVDYERRVFKDVTNQTIIYEINMDYSGTCLLLITSRNWVLIPKSVNNYSVEFIVNEH